MVSFSAAVVVTLALGIGLNTMVRPAFSWKGKPRIYKSVSALAIMRSLRKRSESIGSNHFAAKPVLRTCEQLFDPQSQNVDE